MSIHITCFGGVGEIGGNKILLEDGDTRLLMDFGVSFGRQGKYYNEFLSSRAARGLLDPLMLGFLPPLGGFYREDLFIPGLKNRLIEMSGFHELGRDDRPGADAILLSHAHLDHHGDIAWLDERIPIIASRVSAFITRSMQVTGASSMSGEYTYTSLREHRDTGELITKRGEPYHMRPHLFLEGPLTPDAAKSWVPQPRSDRSKGFIESTASAFSGCVMNLQVRHFPVDHSIPGAMGYAIKTSAGWIAYTGDIRFHGRQGESTHHFAEKLAALHPIALLCEGTHTDPEPDRISEQEIFDRCLQILGTRRGKLAIADFGPRNVERLQIFLDLAKTTRRRLTLQPKDVYLLKSLHLAEPDQYPDPRLISEYVLYNDPKTTPGGWEIDLRSEWNDRLIQPDDVLRDPGEYILAMSLFDLNDLVDLKGIENGVYLFSNSKAYDDEQKADLERLRNWVRWLGLELFGDPEDSRAPSLHASGHASGPELLNFVKQVHPSQLIPIHTETPEWWIDGLQGSGIRLIFPEMGVPLSL
jgi:ribonuclease J